MQGKLISLIIGAIAGAFIAGLIAMLNQDYTGTIIIGGKYIEIWLIALGGALVGALIGVCFRNSGSSQANRG